MSQRVSQLYIRCTNMHSVHHVLSKLMGSYFVLTSTQSSHAICSNVKGLEPKLHIYSDKIAQICKYNRYLICTYMYTCMHKIIRPRDSQGHKKKHNTNATHQRQSKLAALGGTQTHDILCSRQMLYQHAYKAGRTL